MTSQNYRIAQRMAERQRDEIKKRQDRQEKYRLEHSKDYQPKEE